MANNFYAGFNPDLLRPGFMPKIPETLTPSPRTQSPLGPFINPGIGQAVGQEVQQYQPAPQPQSMGSRIQGILGTLLGAQDRTELSKGLLDFGARMMAASAPGPNTSFLGALGQSLPGTRDALEGQRQMAALENFLPEDLRGLPPQYAFQVLQERNKTITTPGGAVTTDAAGNPIVDNRIPQQDEPWEFAGQYQERAFQNTYGTETDPRSLTPQEWTRVNNDAFNMELRERMAGVAQPSPTDAQGPVYEALKTEAGQILNEGREAFSRVQEAERAIELLDRGATSGVGAQPILQAKSALETFTGIEIPGTADDTELRRIMRKQGMDEVQKFKGSTSEKELAWAAEAASSFGANPQANRRYFEAMRRLAQNQIDMRQEIIRASREAEEQGRELSVYDIAAIQERYRSRPLFDDLRGQGGSGGGSEGETKADRIRRNLGGRGVR